LPGSDAFMAAYQTALAASIPPHATQCAGHVGNPAEVREDHGVKRVALLEARCVTMC
jgi:hypothetical protein